LIEEQAFHANAKGQADGGDVALVVWLVNDLAPFLLWVEVAVTNVDA